MQQRVQVAVRVRRRDPSETEDCVVLDKERCFISVRGTGVYAATNARRYRADALLGQELSNRDIFERLVLPKLDSATIEHPETLCFLAYGHTNSGKTHTIAGGDSEAGVLTLCVEELIRKSGIVEVSMVEVFMEAVHDLLAEGTVRQIRRHHGPQGTSIVVESLFTRSVVSLAQWEAVSKYGMRSRRTAATDRNTRSSRSHAIFTIKSKAVRICFVDLAGSERQTIFSPQLNKESISINKSLSRLSTVLEALSMQRVREDNNRPYVNFRDTVLTVLLQRYLCGASLTTFLACVHPSLEFYHETLSTLRYTQRLKRIHTFVAEAGGPGDVSTIADSEHQVLIEELVRLRQQVQEERDNTKLIVQTHLDRITALEERLKQQSHASAVPSSHNSVHANVVADNLSRDKVLKAKDSKRVAGWLVRRALGSLPRIIVGYDEYFDAFFPPKIQVVGYLSTMACLTPRRMGDNSLAFLDVGNLSMGLSIVDASIPPFVRLHRVPCRHCVGWDGQELDAEGHMLYILAFFEASEEVMRPITERDDQLGCCGGYLSLESLFPIAIVLCVAASSPSDMKETALQWLITLQREQEAAAWHHVDHYSSTEDQGTPFDSGLSCHSEAKDNASDGINDVNILMSPEPNSQVAHDAENYDSSPSSTFSSETLVHQRDMPRPVHTFQMNASPPVRSVSTPTSARAVNTDHATKSPSQVPGGVTPSKTQVIGDSGTKAVDQQALSINIGRRRSFDTQTSLTAIADETHIPSLEGKNNLTEGNTPNQRNSIPATVVCTSKKTKKKMRAKFSHSNKNAVKFENCKGCGVV